MILQVVRVGLQRLRHNPVELMLALVVPLVFFTIFALIFDKQLGAGKTKPIRVTTADLDGSSTSQKLLDAVAGDDLTLHEPLAPRHGADDPAAAFETAGDRVLRGEVTIAVVAPEGWAASLTSPAPMTLQVMADTSDPVAPKMIEAVIQRALGELASAPPQAPSTAPRATLPATLPTTPAAPGPTAPGLGPPSLAVGGAGPATPAPSPPSLPSSPAAPLDAGGVQLVDLFSSEKVNPVVSMYAAGIAVMFLLFSATGNAGQLLDEEENQTLERLMCSRLSMTQLILGKWLLLVILGVVQITLMFIWAQFVFGVDLAGHVPGFTLMTLATVSAAASLALVLAAACRSRGQLNAVSVILILTMSALGGSMVPRYLMSDSMQQAGRLTFNAWAIDGYNKIFWRDLPVGELATELLVLGGSAAVLLVVARLLASRWEMA